MQPCSTSNRRAQWTGLLLYCVCSTLITMMLLSFAYRTSSIPRFTITSHSAEQPQHAPGKVLLVLPKDTAPDRDYGFDAGWLDMAISNRGEYAKYHHHDFVWEDLAQYSDEFDIHPQWAKIAALQDAFDTHPRVEWLWCLDSDAIIMNSTIDVWDLVLSSEAMLREVRTSAEIRFGGEKKLPEHEATVHTPSVVHPDDIYLIIADDSYGLNTGSFFIRRNAFMSAFVDLWRDSSLTRNSRSFTFNEQDALAHLLITHPHILQHVAIVNRRLINSYPEDYREGDMVVHFAGCRHSGKDCDGMFVNF